MKHMKHILPLLAFALCITINSCNDDEPDMAKAVLASAATVNFDATHASEKMITVYSDAVWTVEHPEWISVTPSTGSGTTDVTISVSDNLRDGTPDNPRQDIIVFHGATLASRAEVLIAQDGDKYRDCANYTVSQAEALADESVLGIPNALVMTTTTGAFIVTQADDVQNPVYLLIKSSATVVAGNTVAIKGSKHSDDAGLAYVEADEVVVTAQGASPAQPSATDITAQVDTYRSGTRAYVSVSGSLSGQTLNVNGATTTISFISTAAGINLAELNGHNLIVRGYYAGSASPIIKLMLTDVTDLGVNEVIYFNEDFEWLNPWAVLGNAVDMIGTNKDGLGDTTAPQIYNTSNLVDGKRAVDELEARGYSFTLTPTEAGQVYVQKNYLKFGKTDCQGAITLPAMKNAPAGEKMDLTFDWAPMVGSTHKFDPVSILVTVSNGSDNATFGPFTHSFVDLQSEVEWQHAVVPDITVDANTRITIKGESANKYPRWFLDNIKLVKSK